MRLASYNIRKCLGTDRKRAPGRVIEVINGLSADVVVLQEADHRLGPRPAALPEGTIRSYSDFTPVELAENDVSLGWHGNAILLKKGLRATRVERLELPGLEPRGAVMVEAESAEGKLRVIGTHLGLLRRYRLMQLETIAAALKTLAPMPTAILGDFNEWSAHGGMEPLNDLYHVHAPGLSYHARRPVARLDRVALNDTAHLLRAGVEKGELAQLASDHLPIWADVRLRNE
ncbi:endonuclease/exonuclease/phosphatase family protein [Pseudoruegeria sp. SHC-113]|uniref:endonuclease/exonuclease/phosphatase family protein n=1 Tax=Pseudoruegeria sp. SHC-113 TaxID=2855439 RepID=UPI0021BAC0D1|nr:endonuclease/exonuclease/phosphatase family protein [Pseudoruegeria sp. SHC-113]MCT8160869.1 endonuclease/exonuclease/phosphatase family protein [Pseudoruegeria sp. SHC-113]